LRRTHGIAPHQSDKVPVRLTLKTQAHRGGDQPNYADYIAVAEKYRNNSRAE
jgi:hypothetical protein